MTLKGRGFGIRLTADEAALILDEKAATHARSVSDVLERAIVALLEDQEAFARTGLPVPPPGTPKRRDLIPRQFQLSAEATRLIDETKGRYGWSRQTLARAALLRLAEERGRGRVTACQDQPPTQTGA